MVLNTAGYVPVFDFGTPKIVSGKAREVISGGQLLIASGANNVVSSGVNSFATSDIQVATGASGNNFVGIALNNAESGATVSFARGVAAIVTAENTVTAGLPVISVNAVDSVSNVTAGSVAKTEYPIGRALTSAASGGHALVWFD